LGLTSLGIVGLVVTNVSFGSRTFGLGGASATASPEITHALTAPDGSATIDGTARTYPPQVDPAVVISGASLAAGGTILGLRRIAARHRAVR
jgi:hypothetical protein